MNTLDPRTGALLAGLIAALEAGAPAAAQVEEYFVDDDAPPGGDGRTWGTAFGDLQDALDAAAASPEPVSIKVGEGVYKPDRGTGQRWHSFDLRAPISWTTSAVTLSLHGGFAGLRWPNPNERDPDRFVSVLSGDLRGDDLPGFGNRRDNAEHVVRIGPRSLGVAALDGFTIRGGQADIAASGEPFGGGVCAVQGGFNQFGPAVSRCRIVDNFARGAGGGVGVLGKGLHLLGCDISGNKTEGLGGGVWLCETWWDTPFEGCRVVGNTAGEGGGLATADAYVVISRCLIAGNSAIRGGAAVLSDSGIVTFVSCRLTGNAAAVSGGAIWESERQGTTYLSHCTVTHNRCESGPVIELPMGAPMDISKSIVRDNDPGAGARVIETGARLAVGACDLQGGEASILVLSPGGRLRWEELNIDADPLFLDPDGPDNDPLTWQDNDERLGPFSPCIDVEYSTWTPDPQDLDVAGVPRFHDDPWTPDDNPAAYPVSDMGAHEFQGSSCYADCDGNLRVDALDVVCFQERLRWGDPGACDCDTATGAAVCDIFDVLCFLNAFSAGCP